MVLTLLLTMSIYNLISKHPSHRAPGIYDCVVTGHFLSIVTNALSRGPEYEDNYLLISWLLPGARLKIIIFLWVHYLQRVFQLAGALREEKRLTNSGERSEISHISCLDIESAPQYPGQGPLLSDVTRA